MNHKTVLTTCHSSGWGCGMYLPVLDGRLGQPIPVCVFWPRIRCSPTPTSTTWERRCRTWNSWSCRTSFSPGWLRWPYGSADDPGTKFLQRDQFSRGLGTFTPVDYCEPAEEPNGQYPFIISTKARSESKPKRRQRCPAGWCSFRFTLRRARPTCSQTGRWTPRPRYRSIRSARLQ